jgi:DsbC/DsbD-like thiol-disulfide interchange protein
MQQIPCAARLDIRRRGAAWASVAGAPARYLVRRVVRTRHHGVRCPALLKRRVFLVIMRLNMRARIRIHRHETARVGSRPRRPRWAAIPAMLIACHLTNTACIFDASPRAQGLTPAIPAQPDPTDLVRAQLIADVDAITAGKPFRLAVRLEIKEGWHVNWLNPGDAGLAPGVEWRVPAGFKTTVMCWPYPERFEAGPLLIFGYAKELILVTEVTPPARIPDGPVQLGAEVTWLACEEACIPGSATLSLALPVEQAPRPSPWSGPIEAWLGRCPRPAGAWNVDASVFEDAMLLDLQTAEDSSVKLSSAFFYPYDTGVIENASPQLLSIMEGPQGRSAYQLRVQFWRMATGTPERVRGVLVMDLGAPRAIEVDVPLRKR